MTEGRNVFGDGEREETEKRLRLDEMADLHSRVSVLESNSLRLSRRVTAIEDGGKGHYSDDPLSGIFSPGIMWAMVLLTLAPLVIEAYKQWKQSSLSQLSA